MTFHSGCNGIRNIRYGPFGSVHVCRSVQCNLLTLGSTRHRATKSFHWTRGILWELVTGMRSNLVSNLRNCRTQIKLSWKILQHHWSLQFGNILVSQLRTRMTDKDRWTEPKLFVGIVQLTLVTRLAIHQTCTLVWKGITRTWISPVPKEKRLKCKPNSH